jgi:hypothetical protein
MSPNASAVLHRKWCHALLAVSGSVLHECAAQVTVSKLPRATKICDAIANVGFGLKQSGQRASVAQHGCGRRADLHESDLTHSSNGTRIISTLDLHDRVRKIRRKSRLLGLTPDGIEMNLAPGCIGLGHPNKAVDGGRQRNVRELG